MIAHLADLAAAAATAALGARFIPQNAYPACEPIGVAAGTLQSYEIRIGKLGAKGRFDVRLARGELVGVIVADGLLPGERVCLRASLRGDLVTGHPGPGSRSPGG